MFFKSSWGQFDRRFKAILADLARHSQLIDNEANAFAISEASDWRKRWFEDVATREKEKSASDLKAVFSWLEGTNLGQEDDLDTRLNNCHPGSCDWIFSHAKIKAWISQRPEHPTLWLNGKPGSGEHFRCRLTDL
jgi:hypothetical protein